MGTWAGYRGAGSPETLRTVLGMGSRIESGDGWGMGIAPNPGGETALLIPDESSVRVRLGDPRYLGCMATYSLTQSTLRFRTDPLGLCPAYTTPPAGVVQWFASDPRLLAPLTATTPQVASEGLTTYLRHGYLAAAPTLFAGINRVVTPRIAPATEEKTLRSLVRAHLPGSTENPVGVFLDGRRASALLAALLVEAGIPVALFAPDDRPLHPETVQWAQAVANHLHQRLALVPVTMGDVATAMTAVARLQPHPFAHPYTEMLFVLSRFAREEVLEIWSALDEDCFPEELPVEEWLSLATIAWRGGAPPPLANNGSGLSAFVALVGAQGLRLRLPFAGIALTTEERADEMAVLADALLPKRLGEVPYHPLWQQRCFMRGPIQATLADALTPRLLKAEGRFDATAVQALFTKPTPLNAEKLRRLAAWELYRNALRLP